MEAIRKDKLQDIRHL